MPLILHAGAEAIEYDALRSLPVPAATASHVPIAHSRLVDLVRYSLGFHGHEIVDEAHGITPDGSRYFGVLNLRSAYGDYTDMVGLRNSHDKSFPASCAIGAKVFVCDNLSFHGEHVIKRRHTVMLSRDLPFLIGQIIEPLADERKAQALTFERYKSAQLDERDADHAILSMYRRSIIGVQRIADVVREWENPSHDWQKGSGFHLFNAATFSLAGRIAENPQLTRTLHQVIDGACAHA